MKGLATRASRSFCLSRVPHINKKLIVRQQLIKKRSTTQRRHRQLDPSESEAIFQEKKTNTKGSVHETKVQFVRWYIITASTMELLPHTLIGFRIRYYNTFKVVVLNLLDLNNTTI